MTKPAKPTAPTDPALAYIPDEHDIVADMLAAVLELWPDLAADKLRQAEAQIRDRWGGDRAYIQRTGGRSVRNAAILRDHQAGERIPLLARRYQLTQRRIIQILQADPAAA